MIVRLRASLAVAALAILAGCATPAFDANAPGVRDRLLRDFRTGNAQLLCESPGCAGAWTETRLRMRSQLAQEQWEDVAVRTMAAGYNDDLAWFILGRAAEAMGAPDAARTYYSASILRTRAGGSRACANGMFNPCEGNVFPDAAQQRLAGLPAGGWVVPGAAPQAPATDWVTPTAPRR